MPGQVLAHNYHPQRTTDEINDFQTISFSETVATDRVMYIHTEQLVISPDVMRGYVKETDRKPGVFREGWYYICTFGSRL